jgi:DNA modification methylase
MPRNPPTQATPTLPHNTIAQGDCLKTMADWPEDSADLIFADPPYNIGFKYDHYDDNREHDDYVQWTRDWIDACARLLKPTGSLYILIGDEYAAETRLHLRKLQDDKQLVFRNWIIWHYTFGQNCKLKFNRSHAHLFYCVGSATAKIKSHEKITTNPPFTFNRQAIAVPSARQTTYNDARANPKGKLPDDTWYLRPQTTEGNYFRQNEDTWYQSRLAGTFKERQGWHPCQLPEALLERIINVSSNKGDLVFDPFAGSGTTLAAAAKLKRHWLGCELSKDYAKRAIQRIQHVQDTGQTMQVDCSDKGIQRGKPKKKAEPHRSKKDAKGKLVRSAKA